MPHALHSHGDDEILGFFRLNAATSAAPVIIQDLQWNCPRLELARSGHQEHGAVQQLKAETRSSARLDRPAERAFSARVDRAGARVIARAVTSELMNYGFRLLDPAPPKGLARYREAFTTSDTKRVLTHAGLLLELMRMHRNHLRVWKPVDVLPRQLLLLVEHGRHTIAESTRLITRLEALLKAYFPRRWNGQETCAAIVTGLF